MDFAGTQDRAGASCPMPWNIFKLCGTSADAHFGLVALETAYRVIDDRGEHIDVTSDIDAMAELLNPANPMLAPNCAPTSSPPRRVTIWPSTNSSTPTFMQPSHSHAAGTCQFGQLIATRPQALSSEKMSSSESASSIGYGSRSSLSRPWESRSKVRSEEAANSSVSFGRLSPASVMSSNSVSSRSMSLFHYPQVISDQPAALACSSCSAVGKLN